MVATWLRANPVAPGFSRKSHSQQPGWHCKVFTAETTIFPTSRLTGSLGSEEIPHGAACNYHEHQSVKHTLKDAAVW